MLLEWGVQTEEVASLQNLDDDCEKLQRNSQFNTARCRLQIGGKWVVG